MESKGHHSGGDEVVGAVGSHLVVVEALDRLEVIDIERVAALLRDVGSKLVLRLLDLRVDLLGALTGTATSISRERICFNPSK